MPPLGLGLGPPSVFLLFSKPSSVCFGGIHAEMKMIGGKTASVKRLERLDGWLAVRVKYFVASQEGY
jgi:hypothetical protein